MPAEGRKGAQAPESKVKPSAPSAARSAERGPTAVRGDHVPQQVLEESSVKPEQPAEGTKVAQIGQKSGRAAKSSQVPEGIQNADPAPGGMLRGVRRHASVQTDPATGAQVPQVDLLLDHMSNQIVGVVQEPRSEADMEEALRKEGQALQEAASKRRGADSAGR
jgi:hypothetical protein